MISGITAAGIRFAVRKEGSNVGYCALSIGAGTRDEGSYHSGIAHFVEHTLFKGTSRRSSTSINNCLERLGGELNAFTTKEEIVLHATVLKHDMSKAADLLTEIAFDARFPDEEVEIEKGVVLDEIASCKDFPAEDIYDTFEEKLFGGLSLGRPILGTEETVRSISPQELRSFRQEFFTPDRMVFTMVSPLEEKEMIRIIRKASARYCLSKEASSKRVEDIVTAKGTCFNEVVDKGNHEVNCIIGAQAPSLQQEEERLATILLCNILGGPASNSRLGSQLREKHGWVYNVECSYSPYRDNGVAAILFGCDKENLKKCEKAILKEIRRLQEAPLCDKFLNAAKRQMLGQNAIGMENGESLCISMGKNILSLGKVYPDEEIEAKVQNISAATLQKMAREIFREDRLCKLTYL